MQRYRVEVTARVFVDADDEEEAAEKAIDQIKSPLIDRENVEAIEVEQ